MKILNTQLDQVKQILKSKDENTSLDKEVIGEFVKQIEQSETSKANFEDKYKDIKRKSTESRDRLAKMLHLIVAKLSKKKVSDKDLQDQFDKLTDEETKIVLAIADESKITLKRR